MIEYSIVIPVYNEEAVITSSLTQILTFMRTFSSSFEVILADDESTDNSVSNIEGYMREHPEVKLMRNQHRGKGYTVRTGMLMASGQYILMADADMAVPIEELKRLMVWMKEHSFDLVIGSREGVGATRHNEPWIRHFMGRVFNLAIRLVAVPGIQDTQCGFKVFTKEAAHNIFKRLVLFGSDTPTVKQPRVTAFDVEVLLIARKLGYKIKEVPITWYYGAGSKVSIIGDSLVNLRDIFKVRINDLLGKYPTF